MGDWKRERLRRVARYLRGEHFCRAIAGHWQWRDQRSLPACVVSALDPCSICHDVHARVEAHAKHLLRLTKAEADLLFHSHLHLTRKDAAAALERFADVGRIGDMGGAA